MAEEWEQKLSSLPAYMKYKEFNTKVITNKEYDVCKVYYVGEANNKEVIDFCNRSISILQDILASDIDKNREETCNYFRHWFSDNVRRRFSNNDVHFSNYYISDYLFKAINEYNYYKYNESECRCYASRDAKRVKTEKDLHDYFMNFEKISCIGLDKETCQTYLNYLNYIIPLYRERKRGITCCFLLNGEVEPACKSYFKCKNEYDPSVLLKKIEKQKAIIDKYGNVETDKWKEYEAKYEAEEAKNQYSNSYNQNSNFYNHYTYSSNPYPNSYDSHTYDYHASSNYDSINESLYQSRKFHIGLIVTAMIGIFLGLFFYIKFNSARLRRKRRRREQIISDYVNDINSSCTEESSMNDVESIASSTDVESINLTYESSESSI